MIFTYNLPSKSFVNLDFLILKKNKIGVKNCQYESHAKQFNVSYEINVQSTMSSHY